MRSSEIYACIKSQMTIWLCNHMSNPLAQQVLKPGTGGITNGVLNSYAKFICGRETEACPGGIYVCNQKRLHGSRAYL